MKFKVSVRFEVSGEGTSARLGKYLARGKIGAADGKGFGFGEGKSDQLWRARLGKILAEGKNSSVGFSSNEATRLPGSLCKSTVPWHTFCSFLFL